MSQTDPDSETMDKMIKALSDDKDIKNEFDLDLDISDVDFHKETKVQSVAVSAIINQTNNSVDEVPAPVGISEESNTDLCPDSPKNLPNVGHTNEENISQGCSKSQREDPTTKCMACFYCPPSLNPNFRQFTRMEHKLLNRSVTYRDIIFDQPIVLLRRCDSVIKIKLERNVCKEVNQELEVSRSNSTSSNAYSKNSSTTAKQCEQNAKDTDDSNSSNEKNAGKPSRNEKIQALAHKARTKEQNAQKILYDKLLKQDAATKDSEEKSSQQKSSTASKPKTHLPTPPAEIPGLDLKIPNLTNFKIKKVDATSSLINKLQCFTQETIAKGPRKSDDYVSPLDQILKETNRFQKAALAKPAKKRAKFDKMETASRKTNLTVTTGHQGNYQKDVENYAATNKPAFASSSTTAVDNSATRPPLLINSPASLGDATPSSPSSLTTQFVPLIPSTTSKPRKSTLGPEPLSLGLTDGGPFTSQLDKQPLLNSMDKRQIPGLFDKPLPIPCLLDESAENRPRRPGLLDRTSEERRVSKPGLLDRDFKQILDDCSLLSTWKQGTGCTDNGTNSTLNRIENSASRSQSPESLSKASGAEPMNLDSFLNDVVRKTRNSTLLGNDFSTKELMQTGRITLLGHAPPEFLSTASRKESHRSEQVTRGPRTPPLTTVDVDRSPVDLAAPRQSNRPVLLPDADPFALAVTNVPKLGINDQLQTTFAPTNLSSTPQGLSSSSKYPILSNFISSMSSTVSTTNSVPVKSGRITLLQELPSSSAINFTSAVRSSSFDAPLKPALDRLDPTVDVKKLLSGHSTASSLRMSDAESYFMSNFSNQDLSSLLRQVEEEEKKTKDDFVAADKKRKEMELAKIARHFGMASDDESSLAAERPTDEPSPSNDETPSGSRCQSWCNDAASILAKNSTNKWADETLNRLRVQKSPSPQEDPLDDVLKNVVRLLPHNPLSNSHNGDLTDANDSVNIRQALGALRAFLDGNDGPDNLQNHISSSSPNNSNDVFSAKANNSTVAGHEHLTETDTDVNIFEELLSLNDEDLIRQIMNVLQHELCNLYRANGAQSFRESDELLQLKTVFETMLAEPTSILNRDQTKKREVEQILPLIDFVNTSGSESLQNAILTPVMLYAQELIEKSFI